MKNLGAFSLRTEVAYAKEESREKSTEVVDLSGPAGQNWRHQVKDEMVIVYRQASDQALVDPSVLVK